MIQSPLENTHASRPNNRTHGNQGISHHDNQCLSCRALRDWIIDTSIMYRKGSIRLGVFMLVTGAAAVALGATLMVLNNNHAWSGLGIWTGVPVFLGGIVCIVSRGNRPIYKVSPISSLCLLCSMVSLFLVATSCVNLAGISLNLALVYPTYTRPSTDRMPLYAVNSVLLVTSVIQTVTCIWITVLTTGHLSECCRYHKGGIFTISYDDPTDPALDGDTDFIVESFDDVQHVLCIEPDWMSPSDQDAS